ncbi:MAG: TonB-dependent receptor [Opitutae bacterium]|nr:TonB-dependent receptor [Opitutae bacterium]MBT5379687.1 TonB-dependent receptor [Opitutae bacterium]MBT6463064.1 TonB-dependent receptor [Opitutae bacterium]
MTNNNLLSLIILTLAVNEAIAQGEPQKATDDPQQGVLPTLTIHGQEKANIRPATTYESPISNLDFDPRVDIQSRNMAEAQGDISIRGGIFENTGLQVGSATLFDPQTGHYITELPIAPEMLTGPRIYTGAENALHGFNSGVGTVHYDWSKIRQGGSVTLGGGDNNLNFQRIHSAWTQSLEKHKEWSMGYEAEYSRSESDGTIKYSDHNFSRVTARMQLLGPNSQTDFFAGYQSKNFGLYGMYTGDQYTAYNPYETENIKTRLILLNHQQSYAEQSYWEVTAYHRRNSDHYIFNRFSPNNKFIHETDVSSVGLSGVHSIDEQISINHSLQITSDEIESSVLEVGKFTDRTYYKLSIVPEYRRDLNKQKSLRFRAGLSYDDTNRNESKISPIAEISWLTEDIKGESDRTYISYAETTQVVGYGGIGGSETSGLFRSNHDLDRETSQNLEVGHSLNRTEWSLDSALFYRWDDNLVDWVYSGSGARAAENVDIKTIGLEIIATRYWDKLEGIASYSYLHKNEDYGNPAVIGSFYALNYPEHRATLGFIFHANEQLEIRLDNEWREQKENALRSGPKDALYSHVGISYYPSQIEDLEVFFALDKPWDDTFQELPGTPGRSEQLSLGINYRW